MAKGRKTGGRVKGSVNKATAEIRVLAQSYGPAAIAGLALLARTAESETARAMAWNSLLDRGYGKPPQAVTGPDGEALAVPHSVVYQITVQPQD